MLCEIPIRWVVALGSSALVLCPLGLPLEAQVPLNRSVRINATDLAVLEARETRKDLNCTVFPVKPELGFDLRFHAGFDINLPLSEVAGQEDQLTILFRVVPDLHKDKLFYFVQHIPVPKIADDAKGDANLHGAFDLGEGSYHIDWLMRDRGERVCSFNWDSEAVLTPKDKLIEVALPPGTAQAAAREQFVEDPPVERAQGSGAVDHQGAGEFRAAVLRRRHHAAQRYASAGDDAAADLARTSIRQVFPGGVQHSGAARGVPAIQRRQDRFPGAGTSGQ